MQGWEFQVLPAASSKLFLCCPFSAPSSRNKSIPCQVTPCPQEQLVASGEGALGCSARVWHIPAPFPGLPKTPAAGWEGQACSSSSRMGMASMGWRLSAISASRMGEKSSSVGKRGCSSSWDAGFAANTPRVSSCSKDFCLQVDEKKILWKTPRFLSRTEFFLVA